MGERQSFVHGLLFGVVLILVSFWLLYRWGMRAQQRMGDNSARLKVAPGQQPTPGDVPPNPSLDATPTAV
jgi:hypothetical protein